MKSDLHDVEVIYQTQTEKAFCVRAEEGNSPDIWIPKSQCEVDREGSELRRGHVVTLTAPEHVLIDKGLI